MKKQIIVFLVSLVFALGSQINAQSPVKTEKMMMSQARAEPVKAGEVAPDFTLTSSDGKEITLSKVGKPVVLVFYRGYWCPFCARQLAELRGLLRPEEKVLLLAISVDPADKSKDLAAKIAKDGKGDVPFPFLSDPGHKIIDNYGLVDPAYAGKNFDGIPHPAVYVLDNKRNVVWAKVESDYKKRPTNEEIRAALDKLN
ncbi:MAG: peroxiredoxin family protein [Pyrinomonadaceae bacterium]